MIPKEEINRMEIDWLAFCYAADELNAAEAEAFELCLANDQQAREALARAVELMQVVAAAESQAAESQAAESQAAESQASDFVRPAVALCENSNSGFSFAWMAIGGVAAVLLAIVCGIAGQSWQSAQRSHRSAMKAQLASAWYETRSVIANEKASGLWPTVGASSAEALDEMTPGVAVDDFENDEAPSWLSVAVVLAHDRAAGDAANPSANRSLEN